MSKYLVTGGAGFIGSHLVDALLAEGHSVVVIDDLSSGRLENLYANIVPNKDLAPSRKNLQLVRGSIADQKLIMDNLEGVEGCFHLAAHLGMLVCKEEWVETHRINLTATIVLFDALQKWAVKTGLKIPTVYASSCAIYGDLGAKPLHEDLKPIPLSAYGADKLGCELHAGVAHAIYGLANVGLRFFNVYGPRQRPDTIDSGVIPIFIDRLKAHQTFNIFGTGEQTRDFVHVSDVVKHCLFFMKHMQPNARVFNVCSGQALSLQALTQLLAKISGQKLKVEYRPERAGDILHALGDPRQAKAAGIEAKMSFEEGLKALWEFKDA